MTASDFCAARYIFSCQAGAIHTCDAASSSLSRKRVASRSLSDSKCGGGPSVVSEDYGKKMIDIVQLAEFSADQRELDTLKAVNEMVSIAADTGPRAPDPEELMRREAELIAK